MAFALAVVTDTTTTQLNDGAPFRLERLGGASGADVVRLEQRGPLQQGATDLGARIQPRVVELSLLFTATDDATLDSYRDTLMAAFRPLASTPIVLTVTRDDGEVRTLSGYAVDDIAIDLVPDYRPGHLHRATVKLRAAQPYWQAESATVGTISFGTAQLQWWLAGGNFGTADVLAYWDYPDNGATYTGAGISSADSWGILAVVSEPPVTGQQRFLWHDGTVRFSAAAGTNLYNLGTTTAGVFDWEPNGTVYTLHGTAYNYIGFGSISTGFMDWLYWNGVGYNTAAAMFRSDFSGTLSVRAQLGGGSETYWQPEVPRFALYNKNVNLTRMSNARSYFVGSVNQSVAVVNDGDVEAYPLIYLQGAMTNPILTNTTTGAVLDLSGLVIAAGDTVTIDLSGGDRSVLDAAGSSAMTGLDGLPLSLGGFALAPHPVAVGGANTISLSAVGIGGSAQVLVQHTNQYMSF